MASLQDAAAALPLKCKVHLALPASALFFERMRLPSTDPAELRGMMQLQLEKTLPYPSYEVTSDLILSEVGESDSVIVAVAVSNSHLDTVSAPLRAAGRLPEKITVDAMHRAASCSKLGIDLLLYLEEGRGTVVITENGKIGFVQTLPGIEPLMHELPQALLSAELEGVPVIFSKVHLDAECMGHRKELGELLGGTVEMVPMAGSSAEPAMNLFPAAWRGALAASERSARIKSRLILAGGIYLFLILCAVGTLFWMNRKVSLLESQLHAMQPEVATIQTRSGRWNALAPAVNPSRYTVELLYQIQKSMPSDSIRITQFDQSLDQFVIEGEAPTAALAVEYGEQLKANQDLKDFNFEVAQPTILPNEHAQFRIFGKL